MTSYDHHLHCAKDLDDLLQRVLEWPDDGTEPEPRWDNLPLFGGDEPPTGTDCVWSWDEQRLLVGEETSDMRIVNRTDWRK